MFSYSNDNLSMNAHSVRWANFKVSEYANDKLWSALYMTNEQFASSVASIPSKPICDPVEDLNERDDTAPHAQPHESTHLWEIECIFILLLY